MPILATEYYSTQVEIYDDSAPDVLLDVIPLRYEPNCLSELRSNGAGSFKVSKQDPRILANPALIDYRKIVRIRMNGTIVGAFIIQTKRTVIVGEGEEADETWEISGEGLRAWSRDAAVYPAKGLKLKSGDTRYFNFATEQGSWYVSGDWHNAVVVWNWMATGSWWTTAPVEWPDAPSAKWIWDRNNSSFAMPQGYVYFRKEFTVSTAAAYSLFVACDDQAEIYVDGELLHTTAYQAWTETNRIDIDFESGPHVIGIKAYNYKSDGPGGLIGALFKYGDPLVPTSASLVLVTDTSWKVNAYPSIEPGWSMGDVLLTLLSEAATRGVRFADNLTPTFSADLDSSGQSWGDPIPWTFSLGATYEDVFSAVEELGCDIYIDPDNLQISAWNKRGANRSISSGSDNPIVFRVGHNLISAEETGQAQIANTLMLHAQDGWKERIYSDTTSMTKYGRVETQFSTQLSVTGANPLVSELFRTKALPEKSANFDIIPVDGMVPFLDFNVGDIVSAPGEVPGVFESRRVMSIAFSEDPKTGKPHFAIEFDTIFKDRQSELEKWISRIANSAAIGGGFTNTSNLPPKATQGQPGASLGSVPDAPTGLVVSSIGHFAEDGSSTSDYGLTWNAVITGTGFGSVTVTSYEVWGRRTTETEAQLMSVVFDTFAYLQGFRSGDEWAFKVRAISRTGGAGPFSSEVALVAANPIIALGAPSTPTLTTSMGTVTINWDGLIAGSPAPGYVRYVRVDRTGEGSTGTWTEKRRNLFADPRAKATTRFNASAGVTLSTVTDMIGATTTAVRATRTATGGQRLAVVVGTTLLASTGYRTRIRLRSSAALTGVTLNYRPSVSSGTDSVLLDTIDIPVGESYIDISGTTSAASPTSTAGLAIVYSTGALSTTLDITDILIEKMPSSGTMIAGDISSADPTKRYRWTGTTDDSPSVYEEIDPWVQVGTLIRGSTVDASVVTGNAYDYRLVAIDTYGGESTPSDTASITVEGILSGDITGGLASQNLVANGSFEEGFENWEILNIYPNGGSSAEVLTSGGIAGAKYLRLTRGVEIPGAEINLVVGQSANSYIPISAVGAYGYFISAKVAGDAPYSDAVAIYARWFQGDKVTPSATAPESVVVDFEAVDTPAKYVVGQVFPPDDARFLQVVIQHGIPNSVVYVDDIVAREVITSDMIGEDAITSAHLSAGSVTANALQAASVTADALAAGSVLADKIGAGQILTNHLSSEVGSSLDISSNSSINLIVNRQDVMEGDVQAAVDGVETLQTYYSFGAEGAIIGQTDSSFKLYLKNDRIEIRENDAIVSYWDAGQMVVDRFVGNEVVLANHKFETFGNGTIVKKV